MKRKINFNTPPASSNKIASGKNFDGLFESYTKAIGASASSAASGGMSLAGAVKIGFITLAAVVVGLVTVVVLGKKVQKQDALAEKQKGNIEVVSKLDPAEEEQKQTTTSGPTTNEKNEIEEKQNSTNEADEKIKTTSKEEKNTEQSQPNSGKTTADPSAVPAVKKNKQSKESNISENKNTNSEKGKTNTSITERENKTKKRNNKQQKTDNNYHGNDVVQQEEEKVKRSKKKKDTQNNMANDIASVISDGKNYGSPVGRSNNNVELTMASAKPSGLLETKIFYLNNSSSLLQYEEKEFAPQEIQQIKSKSKRRDFDPRVTLGLKTSGYVGLERLFGVPAFTLAGKTSQYSQTYPYEYYSYYLDEESTDPYLKTYNDTITGYGWGKPRAMDIGFTSALRMFGRFYLEMDVEYAQTNIRYERLYWDHNENKRVTEKLGKEHYRNMQTNLGLSYWFGKRNLEIGFSTGVIFRYASFLSDNNQSFRQDFWYDDFIRPYGYYSEYYYDDNNKVGIAGYGQLCFKYNLPKIQVRADIGIPNGWYTSRMSLSASYKFYTLKRNKGYKFYR